MNEIQKPIIGMIMGSISDWETMKHAETTLKGFNLDYECKIISAHRTPELMRDYAKSAEKRGHVQSFAERGYSRPCRTAQLPL